MMIREEKENKEDGPQMPGHDSNTKMMINHPLLQKDHQSYKSCKYPKTLNQEVTSDLC